MKTRYAWPLLVCMACSPATTPEVPGLDVPAEDAWETEESSVEVALDVLPETGDTEEDILLEAQDAPHCKPMICDKQCQFGFRQDQYGCDICECRACNIAADCVASMICAHPECTTDGHCRCDCAASEGVSSYHCPSGVEVPWCACTTLGVRCIAHPEYRCPELCDPLEIVTWPCPDGIQVKWCSCKAPACEPECRNIGTAEEAWFDSCTGERLANGPCAGCSIACGAIGSKSEGWVSSCSGVVAYVQCAPVRECIDSPESLCPNLGCTNESTSFRCPNGTEVPFCYCEPACPPSCQGIGTPNEGWYDCTGKFLKADQCAGCFAVCDAIGSKSEGWYASCSSGAGIGLIGWAKCSQGRWTCKGEPWTLCTEPMPCTPLGHGFLATGTHVSGWCCPGLVSIDPDFLEGSECVFPEIPGKVCSLCGDGDCTLPENPCNCPDDCLVEPPLAGPGEPCNAGWHCGDGLQCVSMLDQFPIGICSEECNPKADAPCPDHQAVCIPIPGLGAPGFCLKACANDSDCPPLTRCVGQPVGGCFPSGPCDPVANWGCGPSDPQCRVKDGHSYCGAVGSLKQGDDCAAEQDKCGPGLVCGSISRCWPVCKNDEECRAKMFDFCLKKAPDRPYGHCMIYE